MTYKLGGDLGEIVATGAKILPLMGPREKWESPPPPPPPKKIFFRKTHCHSVVTIYSTALHFLFYLME